ncbi:upstream stimulatory factor 2-like, partial [Agelaius tricolor]|uniref:upstream stimulatory factor 2-like n=1 Tax=Agelaius tricolor TaxID=9191 RepID=UPI0039F196CA
GKVTPKIGGGVPKIEGGVPKNRGRGPQKRDPKIWGRGPPKFWGGSPNLCGCRSQEKAQESEEGAELHEGEAPPGEGSVAVPGAPAGFPEPGLQGLQGLQCHFRSDANGGQVTYRVVQVSEAALDGAEAAVAVPTFSTGSAQVLQGPFSNGGGGGASPGSEGGAERLTWGGEGTLLQAETTLAPATGQFYVMMTPPEVLQGGGGAPRGLAPHGHAHGHGHAYSPKLEGPRVPRDERRRAQHNEVERRRRDKINNWIVQLSKIIPDCGADSGKSGASKGGILSKACDYVRELRQSNQRLQETFKEAERLQMDNDLLRQQVEELKSENAVLRAQLQQRGLDGTPEGTPQ